jgi:hypothetical protein
VCTKQVCQTPRCDDTVQNGKETEADCGGACKACPTGPICETNAECSSKVCKDGHCASAQCDDGVQNGSEADVDCGPGCNPCAIGKSCAADEDCASGECDTVCKSRLRVELSCSNTATMTACMQPYFRVFNDSDAPVALAGYSIRYYYTKEGASNEDYDCYYMSLGDCNQIGPAVFMDIEPKKTGADRYVELPFADGARTLEPGQLFEMKNGICLPSPDNFTQTGDYSFSGNGAFQPAPRVTLFNQRVLVWGTEP